MTASSDTHVDINELTTEAVFMRQLDWYNPGDSPGDSVSFIGCGGIGSFAAIGAAKLGVPNIQLYDGDAVERHNSPNQFFTRKQSKDGRPKVEALASLVQGLAPMPVRVTATPKHVDAKTKLPKGVVMSGLDSMAARSEVWKAIKLKPQVSRYFDARLGGQLITVYSLNPLKLDDIKHYEETLYSDAEAIDAPCTARGVIDVGLWVSAILTNMLRKTLTGGDVPNVVLLNAETMKITTWNFGS